MPTEARLAGFVKSRTHMQTAPSKAAEARGRELAHRVLDADWRALARAMKESRVVPLTTEDLLRACREMKPSTRSWFESAKNHALYANQGGFYDDVLTFLGIRK